MPAFIVPSSPRVNNRTPEKGSDPFFEELGLWKRGLTPFLGEAYARLEEVGGG